MNPNPPERTQKLRKNIYKYYVAMFFRNMWITMPIHLIYFLDRGLSFLQMGVLEAIIGGVVIVSDVPSGALADIFGRKLSTGGMFLWGGGYGMDHLALFGLNPLRSVLLVLGGFSGLVIFPFLVFNYQKNNASANSFGQKDVSNHQEMTQINHGNVTL